jgi:putative ABC transport system permease protein
MSTLLQDIRYALRLMLKTPGFTAVAVMTLALGIGANTAIFSVINGMLLRPLVYEEGDKLMFLSEWSEQVPNMSFSVENFKDLRDQNTVFEAIMAYRGQNYVMTGVDRAERVAGREVTVGFFDTLRLWPIVGRPFTPEEDKVGAAPVALLGEGFWTRRFARDPNIVGQTLTLNGEPFTVIGVMPGTMHVSMRITDVFTPLMRREDRLGGPNNRGNHPGIYVYARRKPEVSEEQARTEVKAIAQRLAETYPNSNARQSMEAISLHEALVRDSRTPSLVLLGAVVFVLLIACANVANLLLGRTAVRQREIAVRSALGADRWRLIRQLLTESVMLSGIGAVLGLALAYWGVDALVAMLPQNTAQAENIAIDTTVLIFTAVVAVLAGILFGMAPAWQASRPDVNDTLKEGGRGNVGAGHHRLRNALVVIETALALVLMIGTGLMLKSFLRVMNADGGFHAEGVLTASVSGPDIKYREPEKARPFIEQIVARVQTLPGVEAAASALPLLGGWQSSFTIEGRPEPPAGQTPSADITRVSPDYFRVMGIRLLKGRLFETRDHADAPSVAVIDETFVATHFPDEEPLGKRVRFGGSPRPGDTGPPSPWMEVIGVVNHVKHYGVDQDSRVEMYLPYTQSPIPSFTLLVKTSGDPNSLVGAVREAVASVDADVPIYQTRTLESIVADRVAQRRLATILISVFGALAVVLGAVGIYGVTSYSVTQRTQEMGIRMALGAGRSDILRLVIGKGMLLVGVGVFAGLAGAFALARLAQTVLFQVRPGDPPTYFASPLLLLMVALLASYIPARRATKVDPMVALRYE